MTLPGEARAPLGAVKLLADSARLVVRGFGAMFLPAFLPALFSTAILHWTLPAAGDPAEAVLGSGALVWSILLDLVVGTLVAGVLCLIAIDVAVGRSHGIGDYLRQSARQFLPLLVIGIVLSVAIGVGFVFLVLPGLYVAARYLPYVSTTVFENNGWQGVARAEALTRGYRWPLVGSMLLFGLVVTVIFLVAGVPLADLAARLGATPSVVLEGLMTALGYIFFAAFSAAAYLRLRYLQEGVSATVVAEAIG